MGESVSLSKDGKSLELNGKSVDRYLLRQLRETGFWAHELVELMAYDRIHEKYIVEKANLQQLEGSDLRGKTLRVWVSNWEDSEWVEGHHVATVGPKDGQLQLIADEPMAALLEAESDQEYEAAVEGLDSLGSRDRGAIFFVHWETHSTVEVLTARI